MRVSVTQICKFNAKFDRNKDKAKYFEMDLNVVQKL